MKAFLKIIPFCEMIIMRSLFDFEPVLEEMVDLDEVNHRTVTRDFLKAKSNFGTHRSKTWMALIV
jgi:hypothetical protein